MPRINLRDPDADFQPEQPEDSGAPSSSAHAPMMHEETERRSPWLIIGAAVVLLAVVVVTLNQLHVIHLWGKKTPRVVEALPEPTMPAATDSTAAAAPPAGATLPAAKTTPLPTTKKGAAAKKVEAPAVTAPVKSAPAVPAAAPAPSTPTTSGAFAVQVSSWPSQGGADRTAAKLTQAGFNAYVAQGEVNGKTWYRVRVGNYSSNAEATSAITALAEKGFAGGIVVKAAQ